MEAFLLVAVMTLLSEGVHWLLKRGGVERGRVTLDVANITFGDDHCGMRAERRRRQHDDRRIAARIAMSRYPH
jgi:hypothetical protein